MPKHTPGPWSLLGAQIIGGLREDGTTYHRICEMVTHSMEDAETIQANADLICAAPQLLEAVKATFDMLWDMTTDEFSKGADKPAREMLLAAIHQTEKGGKRSNV